MEVAARKGGALRTIGPALYVLWAAVSITLAIAVAGRYLALPAVVATYLVLGAIIKALGRWLVPWPARS